MAINDTLELAVTSSLRGQVVVNTYHFRVQALTVPGGSSPEQELVADFVASALTAYRGLFPSDGTINTVSARQVCGALPLRIRFDQTIGLGGSYFASGQPAAPWLAILSRKLTASAGRSRRGRNFYPVGYEDDFNGVLMTSPQRATVDSFNAVLATEYIAPGDAGALRLVVHSPTLASEAGTECQESSTPITSFSTSNFLTTMRSRRSASGA